MRNATPRRFETLELVDVGRDFGGTAALRALNLRIAKGEFISLLGPSGCGKSTALNCISGLLPPTSGSVTLDGAPIDTVPPERRGFGMVFQSYALFPHLSVRDNVGFGLRMQRLPRNQIRDRVDAALARVQLLPLADRRPTQLSGGQQQRVAIARALVLEPELMLMDEPLSNLDAKLRREMRTEIRKLHADLGLTTIYVTHDQEEALSLSDRIVVLRDGTTQQVGTPDEVFMHPANAFVAGFMGYRNSLAMTLSRSSGRATVSGEGLALETDAPGDVPDGPVEVRIRPDDIDPRQATNQVRLLCDVVEYQGTHFEVLGRLRSGHELMIRTSQPVKAGETVACGISPDRVLVFPRDPEEVDDAAHSAGDQDVAVTTSS
ncbi:MAG TPA: ABC transporter ATP-binding protein [Propionibacteriaceae bacterium]|nr:ABC transporter ATP-binding protein [Propionibacteriaceae bacterium]